MDSKKPILAAVDLGTDTEKVLSWALWLSQALSNGSAYIMMINVMDYALTPPAYLLPYIEKEEEASGEELNQWLDRLKRHGAVATATIAVGRLIETFVKTVDEFPVAALVVGHKSHVIRTSSSERLIKSVNVSTLVVRGKKAEGAVPGAVSVRKILCAVDFSVHSNKAFAFARSLAQKDSSDILMVHIISSLKLDRIFARLSDLSENDRQNYLDHAIQEAEKSICSAIGVCDEGKRIIRMGVPYKSISEIAAERDVDLIVIGAQGGSSTEGVLLGSIAEAIVKSSPCPVMLVR